MPDPTQSPGTADCTLKVEWRAAQDETGYWVAVCPSLGLNAGGETEADLQACIEEVTELLFTDLAEDDDLFDFLAEHGWRPAVNVESVMRVTDLSHLLLPA